MKRTPVIVADSSHERNILVTVNLKKRETRVMSGFSAWENLSYLLEALALSAQQCITEGMSKSKVYGTIREYMMNVFETYTVKRGN